MVSWCLNTPYPLIFLAMSVPKPPPTKLHTHGVFFKKANSKIVKRQEKASSITIILVLKVGVLLFLATLWLPDKIKNVENKNIIHVLVYPRWESNPNLRFRKPSFYPLNYKGICMGRQNYVFSGKYQNAFTFYPASNRLWSTASDLISAKSGRCKW